MSGRAGRSPVLLEQLTSDSFAKIVKRKPLVIVPFGSLEEHGSHLPLCTDAFQAEEVAMRVAAQFDAVVCPSIRYGDCQSTRNFPGTISLRFETVQAIAFDIVSELARNGVDKVMLLTGHAGSAHMTALKLGAMRALEKDPKMKIMVLSDYDLTYELLGKKFPKDDGHGGEIETSRILNIRPELVGESRPKGRSWLPEFMILSDPERYFPAGIRGDTARATAKKGKLVDDYMVKKLCELVVKNFGVKRA